MTRLTPAEARVRFPSAIATRDIKAPMWRDGRIGEIGTLYVLEPGLILLDVPTMQIYNLCTPPTSIYVLSSESLMSWGGSFDILRSDAYGERHTVGGEIKKLGYPYWIDATYNRDSYIYYMMSEDQWRDLQSWLVNHGLAC